MESIAVMVGLFVASFLLGSIPFGLIISKLFFKKDIRQEGSGNIGTTNAMRSLGKVAGAAVFVLDFGKGLLSGGLALLALWFLVPGGGLTPETVVAYDDAVALAFLGCVLGHIFSPWLGFKGGKGVAVAVGCLFVTFGPLLTAIELALFIVIVVGTRYVSAGSIAAAVLCPLLAAYAFLWVDFAPFAFVCCTIAGAVVVWAHRQNIRRLLSGSEHRIGQKKAS